MHHFCVIQFFLLLPRFFEARRLRLVPRPPNPVPMPPGIIMAYGFLDMVPDETLPGIPDETLTFCFFKRGSGRVPYFNSAPSSVIIEATNVVFSVSAGLH
jgi:hypothetical protein